MRVLLGFLVMEKPTDKDDVMDFLLRDIPKETMAKLRAAAAIHGRSLKFYMTDVLKVHLEELEGRRGMTLLVKREGNSKKSKGGK